MYLNPMKLVVMTSHMLAHRPFIDYESNLECIDASYLSDSEDSDSML